MAETVVLPTQPRAERGTSAARKLRRANKIPAVVYGRQRETVSIVVPHDELVSAIRHGARVVDLQVGGQKETALIREIQWDHLGKEVLHVDFARVAADDRVSVPVPLEIKGTAPGVTAGGLLDQPIHTLEVECPALSVPASIRVNINELQLGQAIHVRDINLPEGVKALVDPDAIVVQVLEPHAEAEAAPAPAAEQAEPEVIGRQKGEEEEEEK